MQLMLGPVLIKFTRLTGQNYPNYPNRVIDLVIHPPPPSPRKDGWMDGYTVYPV